MKQVKQYSNWLNSDEDPPVAKSNVGSPWNAIHALQVILLQRNDSYGYVSLSAATRELLGKEIDVSRLVDLVNVLESKPSNRNDRILLALIGARLALAQSLLDLKRMDEFHAQIHQVESELKSLSCIQKSDTPVLWLRRLQISAENPSDMEHLSARLDLANTMRMNNDALQETSVLLDIHLILNGLDGLKRDSKWISLNTANQERFDEINSKLGGSALIVATGLSRFGRTFDSTTTAGDYLHRLETFKEKYPEFDVPFHRIFKIHSAVDAARRLGREDLARAFEAEIPAIWASCPADTAMENWQYRGRNPREWPAYFVITLLRWMKSDFEKGSQSAPKVAGLLLLSETDISHEHAATILDTATSSSDYSRNLAEKLYELSDPIDSDDWEQHFERYREWLWDSPIEVDRSIRHTILLDMLHVKNSKLLDFQVEKNNVLDLTNHDLQLSIHLLRAKERKRLAEFRQQVDRGAVGASQMNSLSDEWHLMSLKKSLAFSVKAVQDGYLKDEDLQEVQNWMEQALSRYPSFFKPQHLFTLQNIAQTMELRYTLFGSLPADAALDAYSRYEKVYIELRRERSILRGTDNLTAKAHVTEYSSARDHYLNAMACCVEAFGPPRLQHRSLRIMSQGQHRDPVPTPAPQRSADALIVELIEWAQKRKARSVLEVLGAEIVIPRSSLAALDDGSNNGALALIRQEADLQMELDSSPSNPIAISGKLDDVRQKMRACPGLERIMSLRDGEAITSAEIQAISQELGPHFTMVDYIHLPDSLTAVQNDILSMVYKNGILVKSDWVTPDLNHEKLDQWVQKNLGPNVYEPLSTDEADEELAKLIPLIATAIDRTEPDDTILLCPTGILFNIPFHAIPVQGRPLIERNPVVYTQSLSILRVCGVSASAMGADSPVEPIAIQALSEAESALPAAPTMAFASSIRARVLSGSDLTKSSFLSAVTQSSLIHFYGHVNFDSSRPLDHSMAIRQMEFERITARDIFDTRLRSGAHVNLIGCSSGRSEVRTNDDQFGLSTALLYAGASSILSTMWDIRMDDAHEFQEAFYEALLEQALTEDLRRRDESDTDPERGRLDLAKVLQKTILRISVDEVGERKAPYHWAAFMLQGYWGALPASAFLPAT